MAKQKYTLTITIDDDAHIVTGRCRTDQVPGKSLNFETAWNTEPIPASVEDAAEWVVKHPKLDHEIMTYETRDQAIGEIATSIRERFDRVDMYS